MTWILAINAAITWFAIFCAFNRLWWIDHYPRQCSCKDCEEQDE